MKLGEMLVRDGRLTEAQLETALRYQARDGGRLGTVLVEHGFVDLDALTVYLGLELGIPIATGAMLERAKRAAVRLLQPTQAFKHKCVPLVLQDRQLVAAIEDPHDFATLETLAQITGYRVLPRVAPELRIYYYIERYYGVPRPQRFVKFGDTPRGDEVVIDTGLPAPPLPGLPPTTATPIAPPGPRPRLRSLAISEMFDDSEALELEAEDLIDTLDAESEAAAEAVPLASKAPEPSSPMVSRPPTSPIVLLPLSPDVALRELAVATDRNRIVEVLLGCSAATFEAAVVFTVRDHMAFGWKAIGALLGHANVEHLLIPLDAPSVVQAALASETGLFHGPPSPSTVNSYFYKVMQCAEPAVVTVGVIQIGKRVVNVLYGHGPSLSQLQLDVMRQICTSAAEAYARLIAVSKRAGGARR
ncbi:MAG TPA: hypothetical protein VN253_01820 [Kofleriaceae bacterium]|nr:hypothetical protein [Kofleriaceae bacterium]